MNHIQEWAVENPKAVLERQEAFYETIRDRLESESFGKWAVVSQGNLVGVYDSNREASEIALKLYDDNVCLVKRIGYVIEASTPMIRVKHVPFRDIR